MNGNGFRGDQNSEANLHLSGYGPSTTEADIRALFTPHVPVLEVVMKNGFAFLNTASAEGAKRAREVLSGSILGGRALRINSAARKAYEPEKKVKHDKSRLNYYGRKNFDDVQDERGTPATKNLFVAGFGAGTTDQQLRDLFSQHCTVTSICNRGSFAFVNTDDKASAVRAREVLSNKFLNGGALRINFAKESGRLGTSFK